MSSGACGMPREGRSLWEITPSRPPHGNTPSPCCKRQRTDTGSTDTAPTRSTPGTPRATQHYTPDPAAGGAST